MRQVYAELAAPASPRGQQVLARFPGAEVVEVPSHWKIAELHGNEGNVERWVRVKSETLVLGVKKSLTARPNGRSANWIAPRPPTAAPWPVPTSLKTVSGSGPDAWGRTSRSEP